MTVLPAFPRSAAVSVADLLDGLAGEPAGGPLAVGDERVRDFLVAFGRRLLAPAVSHAHPELGSLGFFLRKGFLAAALADVSTPPGVLRFPRGLILHIPPSNVDTVFAYSWALAAFAGNRNVVRVSSRAGPATAAILDVLNETLAEGHEAIGRTQRIVTYERGPVTAELSAACDLRVIWGGDDSVDELRRLPLPPAARDLTFPDRSSFAVLCAEAWRTAPAATRRAVAEGLCNDVFWFGQAACGSPRTIFWIGGQDSVEDARRELADELEIVVSARDPAGIDAAMAVQKYVSAYGLAADGVAERVWFAGNAVAHVQLAGAGEPRREWLGAGTFVWARLDRLVDLAALLRRRDQTVTYFGFTGDELVAFARAAGGRGVDRIVPVGRALEFAAIWDGYDLVREFSRLVTLR